MATAKTNLEEVRAIIGDACARGGLLILITKYLRFESRFVHLDGNEIHVQTTTGGEDALNILKVSEIGLRFPYRLDFLETSTKFLGLGDHQGAKTVKLSMPISLYAHGGRKSPRVILGQGAYTEFSLDGRLVRAVIDNISVSGLRLTLSEDLPRFKVKQDDRLMLSIRLSEKKSITNSVVVRNMEYRSLGVEFDTTLAESDLHTISSWVFSNQEKELDREAERSLLGSSPNSSGKETHLQGCEVLLVTRDDGLAKDLGGLMGTGKDFHRAVPTRLSVKIALSLRPHLVIFHAADAHPAGRAQLKSLSEHVPWETPILLLGTGLDNDTLMELGRSCRAVSTIRWEPAKSPFLHRLILGILRKYYGETEAPLLSGWAKG